MAFHADYIKWFRESSPYIDAHRGSTFVLYIDSHALESQNFNYLMSDIALLSALGVQLVVTFSAELQIEQAVQSAGAGWPLQEGRRVSTPDVMKVAAATYGQFTTHLMARLSSSAPEAPIERSQTGREISITTGSFLKGRPLGIVDGVDHEHTGVIRKVNADAIRHQLEGRAIVLVPALGYSPSGEFFYLDAAEAALEIACSLGADKLIYLTESAGIEDQEGALVSEIDLSEAAGPELALDTLTSALLAHSNKACHMGVRRCHLVSGMIDGALIEELFTRDGCGTQIVGHSYENVRPATLEDVPGILKLIEPMETSGALVKRSRELLETEIEAFSVIERDGLLISCAALYEYDDHGELACLVTHPDYRKSDRGDRMLDVIERKARRQRLNKLFVLTTQSEHWFIERGFVEQPVDSLPEEKQAYYNYQRSSKVLSKDLPG